MSKNGLVQVPNELIENEKIRPNTTYLYLMIKLKAALQDNNTFILNMYSDKFLDYIKWTQPTFMKHLKILHSMDLVIEYDIPKFKPMKIHIQDIFKSKESKFVQIDRNTVNKILETSIEVKTKDGLKNYSDQAIRLYYYYEDKYNEEKKIAFPTFEQITKHCKISKSTIMLLNKHLKKQKLLYVEHGKKWFIDENGRPRKENNRYIPLCKERFFQ